MFLHFETHCYTINAQESVTGNTTHYNSDDMIAIANIPSEFTTFRAARAYLDRIRRLCLSTPLLPHTNSLPNPESYSDPERRLTILSGNAPDEWYLRSMRDCQQSFFQFSRPFVPPTTTQRKALIYLEMKQLIIDLDRPSHLQSYYPTTSILNLGAQEERLARGPTMPRFDMLLAEVVAPLFRAGEREESDVIRGMADDLVRKCATEQQPDDIE
jgi:hypothetical protein